MPIPDFVCAKSTYQYYLKALSGLKIFKILFSSYQNQAETLMKSNFLIVALNANKHYYCR